VVVKVGVAVVMAEVITVDGVEVIIVEDIVVGAVDGVVDIVTLVLPFGAGLLGGWWVAPLLLANRKL